MNIQAIQPYFLLLVLVGVFILSFFIFQPFLTALSLAAVFALVLQPLYQRILRRAPSSPGISALITILICIVCLFIPLGFIAVEVLGEAQRLYASLSDGSGTTSLSTVVEYGERIARDYIPGMESANLSGSLNVYVKEGLGLLTKHLGGIFSQIAQLLIGLFIFTIGLYYLLSDGPKLKRAIIELSPLSDTDDMTVFDRLELAVNSVVRGNLAVALIQGILTGVGFTLFGVTNSILWGVVAAVAALVPGIGTAVVIAPAVAFLFIASSTVSALGLLLWGILAVGLVDNFLGPRFMGRGMELHPLLVLLSVLGGIALFGPAGIFLGPLSVSLLFALLAIYTNVSKKNLA